jgi:hypothetical protein
LTIADSGLQLAEFDHSRRNITDLLPAQLSCPLSVYIDGTGVLGKSMNKRFYVLLPDVAAAKQLASRLAQDGIGNDTIYAVVRDNALLEELPAASVWQTSDFRRAVKIGLIIGGLGGLVAGLYFALTLDVNGSWASKLGIILGGVVAGAMASMILSSLQDAAFTNKHLRPYQTALD